MTRDELYAYLHSPKTLGEQTLPELRALVTAYPYCATFIYLYLYNLALVGDLRYSQELRRLAIFLPDRQRLYREVELATEGEALGQTTKEAEDAFSLIDSFLSDAKAQGVDLPQSLCWGSGIDREDYFARERSGTPAEQTELPTPLAPTGEAPRAHPKPSPHGTADQEYDLDEALFTETLASIYIKQGRYDKALKMIHSISLNYPKKNRYFAQQIRFLERLILNKKETI